MQKLMAVDANSLIHRAFHAIQLLQNPQGEHTNAVFGFFNMLFKALEAYEPSHLLIAFDHKDPTFRHKMFEQYKAGRRETPEELRSQFPMIMELLPALGFPTCQVSGFEADDILGTCSAIAKEAGMQALLVTGDKDALQLIGAETTVLLTRKGISDTEYMDIPAFEQRYGVKPDQFVDVKGFMGDSSDNIPGIPGVGEKTALKLISEYGDMENVFAHVDDVRGAKLKESLKTYRDQALFSRELARIDCGVPLNMALDDMRFVWPDARQAQILVERTGSRMLYQKLIAHTSGPAPEMTTPVREITQTDIFSLDQLGEELKKLTDAPLALHVDDFSISVSQSADAQLYVPRIVDLLTPGVDVDAALRMILDSRGKRKLITYDVKRLLHMLGADTDVPDDSFDVMIAAYLAEPTLGSFTLGHQKERFLADYSDKPAGAAMVFALHRHFCDTLPKNGLMELYKTVEQPLTRVLYDMEQIGFMVDVGALTALSREYSARVEQLTQEIYGYAKQPFNINSPKQLGGILFETLNLPGAKKTKTGYATGVEVLEQMQDAHPIIPLIMEYRQLTKLTGTYLDTLSARARQSSSSRIHTTFLQTGTATGRISSMEPNLQNIPVRTALGREIRRAFVAREGYMLVDADYSQIELRVLAHLSEDPNMLQAFREGQDIHTRTAALVFGVPLEAVESSMRSAAKAVNFGIVYGISDFGLARNLSISRKKAAEYIQRFFDTHPGVHNYLQESVAFAKEHGYSETLLGRRRSIPELKSSNYNTRGFGERIAMNTPVQGAAADIIKLAMIAVHRALAPFGDDARLILQVHDELIVEAVESRAEEVARLVDDCMEHVLELRVPLRADVSIARDWYNAK